MFDARFTPIETPFVTVARLHIGDNADTGDGRYEIRARNGKHYFAIVADRKIRQAWTKTRHTLQRGKPAWDFVVRQLREHNHVD